ncbi:MAG TPA: hypothetical protein DCR13_04195 [Gammaproteobacteria bacterium]|nr:hypothetical protein [Gammaproteobacteria bacterium]HAU07280.1 hypothetical protein [Gammaproteobacteria bacterium]
MTTEADENRRKHFRVDDVLYLQYELITDDEAEKLGEQLLYVKPDNAQQDQDQLRVLQTTFVHLNAQINYHDRDIARALRILNDKINIISRTLQKQSYDEDVSKEVAVNLSGGGIAFMTNELMPTQQAVHLQLELRSSGTILHTVATVLSCNKSHRGDKENPYYLRLIYTHMNKQDRDLLIKHILFAQAEQLRANNTKFS